MRKDTKSSTAKVSFFEDRPMWLFLGWIIAALVSTVFAMYFINVHYGLANEQIGSLGGAFQGTVGVAASIAGAVATIYLAKIAINLGRESNAIAERQERNEDPVYLKAREILSQRDELLACIVSIQYFTRIATHNAGDPDISASDKKNLFSCYFNQLNPNFSRLIVSITPYILNLIASKPNEDKDKRPGGDWLFSSYKALKAIDNLKSHNGENISPIDLNVVLKDCSYILSVLNWKEVSSLVEIFKCLQNENVNRIPNDVLNDVAKFTVQIEALLDKLKPI